jgi:adenosylhomocysteine nucleosidase
VSVLFVAALEEETVALRHHLEVLHVGVGKVESAACLGHHLARRPSLPELIVNVGTAGGLQGQALAEIVEVATVFQHDFDHATASAFVGRELPGGPLVLDAPKDTRARLATGDRVITDPRDRDRLARSAELVDMEGYAVAAVATRFGVPIRIVKAISDGADGTAQTSWTDALRRCSDGLAGWVATARLE